MKDQAKPVLVEWLKHWEGCPADERGCYMYLDSAGIVTAGYGFAIPNDVTAQRFMWRAASGATATPADVHNAFCAVFKRGPNNMAASSFAPKTTIRMSLEDAELHLYDEMGVFESVVKQKIANFEMLPAAAQISIMDMAWNLGPNFTSAYPMFLKSILSCDFTGASTQCDSRGTSPDRLSARRALLEYSALTGHPGFEDIVPWHP